MNSSDIARYRGNRQGEIDSAHLYRVLSRSEKDPRISKVYTRLADTEEKHAEFWAGKMREKGAVVPEPRPGTRARLLGFLGARFGARFVLPTIVMMETTDRNSYDSQPEAKGTTLSSDEHSHGRLIKAIAQTSRTGVEGGVLARVEGRHRSMGGNALRAAVLGVNDGLVSNLSLIMGVAGAALNEEAILVIGFAGLLAGAASMAMGEWLSVQSSRELYERQIAIEAAELKEAPEEEKEELALIYEAKGIPKEEARKLADALFQDESKALDALSREELGIDPQSLGGSAWEAAVMSFVLFCAGAIVPLAPFFFLAGSAAVVASLAVSALALFFVGALITLLTGRPVLFSGLRQLAIGLAAAGLTFGLGRLLGVALS